MKEADLFRQYAQEAARSSSNATSQEEKRCSNAACLHMGSSGVNEREGAGVKQLHSLAALSVIKGDSPCLLIPL
jgi:hypothetical protein